MDDVQTDHLKAYGLTYRAIQAGLKAEWLLNYRGGSFLIPDLDALRRDAALNGIRTEPVDSAMTAVRGEIEANNMRSEEHTSELQSRLHLVCRLLLEKKKKKKKSCI